MSNPTSEASKLLAPKSFRPATGVLWAKFLDEAPHFVKRPTRKGRMGLGVKYEEQVQDRLLEAYPDNYIPSPWILFKDSDAGNRFCQPDGLLLDIKEGLVTIVEIKYQHTEAAYFQLVQLYLPVLRKLFKADGRWTFSCVEITKWYDPAVAFPEHQLVPRAFAKLQPSVVGVNIWNPSRSGRGGLGDTI